LGGGGLEYTINKLSKLAGISARTLRYYDQINLLKPVRINSNNYRIYGQKEVDLLQQILFYRELGVSLEDIRDIVSAPGFDSEKTLENHLSALLAKRNQLDMLIANVTKTISVRKGETNMSDREKFEGFKQKLIDENEQKYGDEIREEFGVAAVDASNAKLNGMTAEQWENTQRLSEEISETLKTAFEQGDPASETAQKACDLHRQWLCMFWKDGAYSKESHKGLGEMYVADERFKAYYDGITVGCAEFLRDALNIYCE
jgi:DNA-binding transcriptional MerR regulator